MSEPKRKNSEHVSPLTKETRDLITQDMHKTEELNSIFPQSSLASAPATPPGLQEAKAGTGGMKNCPSYEKMRFETS